jgi:hypothetical protein
MDDRIVRLVACATRVRHEHYTGLSFVLVRGVATVYQLS